MRTIVQLKADERLSLTNARLIELLVGKEPVTGEVMLERLAQKRDPRNENLAERLELAYLVKLKSSLQSKTNPYVETVIAGKEEDSERRVFARLTNDPDLDGTTLCLYTRERSRMFESIPVSIELTASVKGE